MIDEKRFKQAFVSLRAFRSHIFGSITQAMVDEYHSILQTLQKSSGEDLLEFMIPMQMVKPRVISETRMYRSTIHYQKESEIQYTSLQYCDKVFFKKRVDGLWERFSEKPKADPSWQDHDA